MTGLYEVRGASVRYGRQEVLASASLQLHAGEFVAVAGPNGAGKSTLLSLLAGLRAPSSGECFFCGQPAVAWNRRAFAKRVAVMTQTEPAAFPFTAEQIVGMGRMPHAAGLYETARDLLAVERALAETETTPLRAREFRTLSGGEKQRVLLAAALAQEPEVLLLDEPAAHLDLQHQLALHKLLLRCSANGMLVVAVTHDLNLAAAYAGRIVMLHRGRICADGTPAEVFRPALLHDVFQVQAEVHHRASGQPWLVYGE